MGMCRMNYVIASCRMWNPSLVRELQRRAGKKFFLITRPQDLKWSRLRQIRPRYIFFPHWSFKIPAKIFVDFECVIFHMTDVPFGRGGSPLQNLVTRGIYKTKIAALRAEEKMDAGPVYLKRDLTLEGAAQTIYERATDIIQNMILEIIRREPKPQPQKGRAVNFKRRKPFESDLRQAPDSLGGIYDYIRMLDAEGYPKAFLESGKYRFEFFDAAKKPGRVEARVRITKRK